MHSKINMNRKPSLSFYNPRHMSPVGGGASPSFSIPISVWSPFFSSITQTNHTRSTELAVSRQRVRDSLRIYSLVSSTLGRRSHMPCDLSSLEDRGTMRPPSTFQLTTTTMSQRIRACAGGDMGIFSYTFNQEQRPRNVSQTVTRHKSLLATASFILATKNTNTHIPSPEAALSRRTIPSPTIANQPFTSRLYTSF